jgi:thymidylate kinase
VRQTYLDLAAANPDRIRVVNAGMDQPEVIAAIERELDTFCGRHAIVREQKA